MKIKIFLPCRAGSQRIKNKNIKKFHKFKNGLFELKIEQLLKIRNCDEIVVSTNDKKIINLTKKINKKKIRLDVRPDYLCLSTTKTDDLVKYVPKIFEKNDNILWTHVTCPFFDNKDYDKAINKYILNYKKYDCLVGANMVKDFLFNSNKPVNYNFKKSFWPNTQNLKTLYKINNTIFLTNINSYIKLKNRIGKKIFFHEVEKIKSIDIDYPPDFQLAEKILSSYDK
tara:strand:- start:8472 stop:9152 length:681 start_codon:yes stop_codon:yes gene_type:complete